MLHMSSLSICPGLQWKHSQFMGHNLNSVNFSFHTVRVPYSIFIFQVGLLKSLMIQKFQVKQQIFTSNPQFQNKYSAEDRNKSPIFLRISATCSLLVPFTQNFSVHSCTYASILCQVFPRYDQNIHCGQQVFKNGPTAKAANVIVQLIFCLYALPQDSVRNRDSLTSVQFFVRVLCSGHTKTLNQELESQLCSCQATWDDNLTWFEYAHNTLPSSATGLSPFAVVYGF